MDQSQNSAIMLLVDALSKSLQNLSDKINSHQIVLSHIDSSEDKQILQINELISECSSLSDLLKNATKDYYEKFNSIGESVGSIRSRIEKVPENIKDEHNQIIKKIEECSLDLKNEISNKENSIKNLNDEFKNLKDEFQPLNTFCSIVSKPVGLIVFLIGMLLASVAVLSGITEVVDFLKKSGDNITTISHSSNSNNSIK